jgi:lipid-A-disaccharide synthase
VFGAAAALVAERAGALEVVVPAVPRLADTVRAAVASWRIPTRVVTEPDARDAAFRTARAALAKSGTSTLELALAGIPMVAAYKVPLLEEAVGRLLITIPNIILANLVLGENVVPQFLQRDFKPERLAAALLPLLSDTQERRRQIEAFARLDAIMEIGTAMPSDRAAAVVLDCAGALNQPLRETVASTPPTA